MYIVEALENHNIYSYSICRNTFSEKKCGNNLGQRKTILSLFFYCGNPIVLDLNRLVWMIRVRVQVTVAGPGSCESRP